MTGPAQQNALPFEQREWPLEGVSCADCARKAAARISGLNGVEDAEIRVMASSLVVRFSPGMMDLDEVGRALADEGMRFAAEIDPADASGDQGPPDGVSRGERAPLTVVSGILFGIGLLGAAFTPDPLLLRLGWWSLQTSDLLLLVGATVGGLNFFPTGVRALLRMRLDMHVLMSVAITGAVVLGEFVEAASIAFLFSLAELLEEYSVDQARRSLRELMELAPDRARLLTGTSTREVDSREVGPGDRVAVRAGERVPVDGEVSAGSGAVDQSPITGESVLADRQIGDQIYAGSVLADGYLEVTAGRVWSDSTLQRIVRLVQESESRRAPVERFVDRFARWYTPAVVLLAILVMAVPPMLLDAPFRLWFLRGLTLLVIACPCALVISTPVSVVSALTAGARNGVLIKGGEHLEALGSVSVVAFDKTGTLTEGRPRLVGITPLDGMPEHEILRIAAALETRSAHPLASAVTDAWEAQGAGAPPESGAFDHLAGRGVEGELDGVRYRLGRPALFDSGDLDARVGDEAELGRTVSILGRADGSVLALLSFADVPRAVSRDTVQALRDAGIGTIAMVTGDDERTARAVASAVGIDMVFAGLLPEEKVEVVERLRAAHGSVAMVGDGVNDAPALAQADVGIAMGAAGSDTALETCDVALMADDLLRLPYAVHLSRQAGKVIRQNISVSLLLKIVLAIGVIPGYVTLITAVVVGDMGASLAVTLNAMRLARTRP